MSEGTFRQRAQRRANKTGLSHYICVNHKTCKTKIFRHGQSKPKGWHEVTRVKPSFPSEKDEMIDRMFNANS